MRLETARTLPPATAEAVGRLLAEAAAAAGHEAIDADRWRAARAGAEEVAAVVVAWDGDRPAGYAQATRERTGWALDLALAPAHRGDEEPGTTLLTRALDAVGAAGGGRATLWRHDPTPDDDARAAAAGLTERRDLHQLRRPLPTGLPHPALVLRPIRPDDPADLDAWLHVNNRAFAWHPEQGGWDHATLRARMAEPWFDPAGFLVHERDGRLAGFCWTKVHADEEPPVGEIHVIAVDPDAQGGGLGRDLVVAGLDHLAGRGLRVGMLYVDASNAPAVALYAGLGFELARLDRAYSADVAAQTSTPTAAPTTEPMV